jgi:hypothetical protein
VSTQEQKWLQFPVFVWCSVSADKWTPCLQVNSRWADTFSAFHKTKQFITMFTRTRHWSPSWATLIQCIYSHPISLRFILIFIDYSSLCLSRNFFLPFRLLSSSLPCIIQSSLILLSYLPYSLWREKITKFLNLENSSCSCYCYSLMFTSALRPQTPSTIKHSYSVDKISYKNASTTLHSL